MNGKTLQRAGMGGEGLGELPRGFMASVCLFLISFWETSKENQANKEVHIILATSDKTCTSLVRNVCLSSIQHLF